MRVEDGSSDEVLTPLGPAVQRIFNFPGYLSPHHQVVYQAGRIMQKIVSRERKGKCLWAYTVVGPLNIHVGRCAGAAFCSGVTAQCLTPDIFARQQLRQRIVRRDVRIRDVGPGIHILRRLTAYWTLRDIPTCATR